MSDNELLLAISNMMDVKLKAGLAPIKNDVQEIKQDVHNLKSRMQSMESRMQSMESRMQSMENRMQNVENEVCQIKNELRQVKNEVHQIKLCQENVILPRLNTIEACYTETFKRYKDNADKMDAAFEDIALLKETVAEHSEQIQKLQKMA